MLGGTLNQSGVFRMRAVRVGEETTLAQICRLVEAAQLSKGTAQPTGGPGVSGASHQGATAALRCRLRCHPAPIQAYADRVAAIFVPLVLGLSTITFFLWTILIDGVGVHPAILDDEPTTFAFCLKLAYDPWPEAG